jgi:hypothetical protein
MSAPPPFIKLFGITYTIREKEWDQELPEDEVAKCYPNAALIIYDQAADEGELRDTILHEILHIIDFKMNGKFKVKESVICQFAAGVTHALRDNSHFADWMVDDD